MTDPEDLIDEGSNASDPKQLKQKALTDLQYQLQKENDLRAVLATAQGRRFLVSIFDICGHNKEYFQPNHGLMAATAGRRQISRQIEESIRMIKPDGLALWQLFDAEWQAFQYPEPVKKKR